MRSKHEVISVINRTYQRLQSCDWLDGEAKAELLTDQNLVTRRVQHVDAALRCYVGFVRELDKLIDDYPSYRFYPRYRKLWDTWSFDYWQETECLYW